MGVGAGRSAVDASSPSLVIGPPFKPVPRGRRPATSGCGRDYPLSQPGGHRHAARPWATVSRSGRRECRPPPSCLGWPESRCFRSGDSNRSELALTVTGQLPPTPHHRTQPSPTSPTRTPPTGPPRRHRSASPTSRSATPERAAHPRSASRHHRGGPDQSVHAASLSIKPCRDWRRSPRSRHETRCGGPLPRLPPAQTAPQALRASSRGHDDPQRSGLVRPQLYRYLLVALQEPLDSGYSGWQL